MHSAVVWSIGRYPCSPNSDPAKLMLNRVDSALMRDATKQGPLSARVRLTDDCGAPRCARVDPPAIVWHVD
jgi:hypothetical protein